MNRILEIKVTWKCAEALCEDEAGNQVRIAILPEERRLIAVKNGAVAEEYKSLQESVYSRYGDVFLLLQREVNVLNRYHRNVLREIRKEEKSFERDGNVLRAVSCFTLPGGEKYIASVCHDYTEEIPQYTLLLQDGSGHVLEAYEALYRAEDSFFYPVFADLENTLEKQSEEAAE